MELTAQTERMGRLEREAWEFHLKNPEVWTLVWRFAAQAKARGFQVFAIDNIWGAIRWERILAVGPEFEFKMPNNHRAYYARWYNNATDSKFFKTCRLRSVVGGVYDRYGRSIGDFHPIEYEGA